MSGSNIINVMSFNVHCQGKEEETPKNAEFKINTTVKERVCRLRDFIYQTSPDILGVQEFSKHWREYEKLFDDVYDYVGTPTAGTSEANYIFFKRDMFKLVESDTFWLAPGAPKNAVKYPGAGWDRIFTYALLEKISDSSKILIINTHFDHLSEEARSESPAIIAQKEQELQEIFKEKYGVENTPVMICGDFNSVPGSGGYNGMLQYYSHSLLISQNPGYLIEETTSPWYSYYESRASLPKNNHHIDHIFVKGFESLENQMYLTNSNLCKQGIFLSDHCAITAKLKY